MLALTHLPSPYMNRALRTFIETEAIDLEAARRQHDAYCDVLARLGARVRRLDCNLEHPDCVFIEDAGVVLDELAILCSMGHASRRAEATGIAAVLSEYRDLRRVELPATIDGGDVLRVDRTLFVGLSGRTNAQAADAVELIVGPLGYRVVRVPVRGCLHLKSAVTALPDGRLLVNPAWLDMRTIESFPSVRLPEEEPDAANVCLVGQTVCAGASHPHTIELIERLGFAVEAIDLGEFAKAEGCVTCMSLLFSE